MKKLLGIVFLILLSSKSAHSQGVGKFYCLDHNSIDHLFTINLNNMTMKFGWWDYKIFKLTDENIIGKTTKPDTDGSYRSIIFNRYTGKWSLSRYIDEFDPISTWRMKCRKLDPSKKIF